MSCKAVVLAVGGLSVMLPVTVSCCCFSTFSEDVLWFGNEK